MTLAVASSVNVCVNVGVGVGGGVMVTVCVKARLAVIDVLTVRVTEEIFEKDML